MFNAILKYFTAADDRAPDFIALVRNIIIFTLVAIAALTLVVSGVVTGREPYWLVLFILLACTLFEIISLVFVLRGNVIAAKIMLPIALNVAVAYILIDANGLHDVSVIGIPLILIISMILQGGSSSAFPAVLTVATITVVSLADMYGITRSDLAARTGLDDTLYGIIFMAASAYLLGRLVARLNKNIDRARANEKNEVDARKSLEELQASLEERITTRTKELESSNAQIQRRASQLQAISDTSALIANLQSLDELLPAVTRIISERFGYYHVGIFLIDEDHEFAILKATNSLGGKRMLARGHRIKIGETGMVGFVSNTGQPRIALDVGSDVIYFNNPDLPTTRSEISVPLSFSGNIIGVLDLQSELPGAFSEEDIPVLSALASQVTIAIENARLFTENKRALAEVQTTIRQYVQQGWSRFTARSERVGVVYSGANVETLSQPIDEPDIRSSLNTGNLTQTPATLAVPIKLRGETIGVVGLKTTTSNRNWNEDEIAMAQAAAERVALAIETARLVEEAQRRASKERMIGEIGSRLSAAANIDTIMQTAVEELGRAVGSPQVTIQFHKPQEQTSLSGEE